mgnify:CR=1 FL=1
MIWFSVQNLGIAFGIQAAKDITHKTPCAWFYPCGHATLVITLVITEEDTTKVWLGCGCKK